MLVCACMPTCVCVRWMDVCSDVCVCVCVFMCVCVCVCVCEREREREREGGEEGSVRGGREDRGGGS